MGIQIVIDTNSGVIREEWDALIAFATEMKKFGNGDRTLNGVVPPPNAEKIAEGLLADLSSRNSPTHMPPAEDCTRRETPVFSAPLPPMHPEAGKIPAPTLAPADNPSTGIDPDLASFGVPNAPGGTVMGAPTAAAPVAGAAPSLPPVTPPVPTAPGTVAAPQASLVPLDKNGLPWDSRIHASTKTQNADATWRNKRGVSDEEIARVTAELRQVMAIPRPAAAVPTPPPGVPGAPAGPMTFIKLMPKVTAALTSGQITKEHVDSVLQRFGFPHLPALAPRADLVPQVHDAIFGAA